MKVLRAINSIRKCKELLLSFELFSTNGKYEIQDLVYKEETSRIE